MNSIRNGVSNILAFVLLAGLIVVVIALFNGQTSGSAVPNVSPVVTPTIVGVQASPLSTPTTVNVPVARLGEPVLVHASGPASLLSGDQHKLVSIGRQNGKSSTMLLDLTTGEESKVADATLLNERFSGHWLVGEDQSPLGPPDYYIRIKAIDMDTGEEIDLGDTHANQQRPSISGDIVVWEDRRNKDRSGTDIYAYDLKTGKEFTVTATISMEIAPRVSGQWVTYLTLPTQYRPGEAPSTIELRAHSLKTGEDFSIGMIPSPNNASWGTYHAIDGDKVAWVKVTDAVWPQYVSELHLYDLTTRTDRTLTEPIPNRPPTDISLSAKSGLVVYNSPTQHWVVLDWRPAVPVPLAVTEPIKSIGDHLMATGDYLVWRLPLNHDTSDVKIFAVPVTR